MIRQMQNAIRKVFCLQSDFLHVGERMTSGAEAFTRERGALTQGTWLVADWM